MAISEEHLKHFLEEVKKAIFWIYLILLIIWVNTAPRWWRIREKLANIFNPQAVGIV
jgi:hypothetical protein